MRTRQWTGIGILAAALLYQDTGYAQESAPPFDADIEVQLFEYAIGPRTFLTVADADVAYKEQLSADFLLMFLTNPFTIYNVEANGDQIISERTRVVKTMLAGELTAAYGITPALQVGVALPLVFSMSGDGIEPTTAMALPGGIQATGLGDFRAEAKYRLWENGKLGAAAIGGLTVPTSFGAGGSDFLGDDLPSLRARLAAKWSSGKASAGANVGVILRKEHTLYASTIGQQLTYGGAGAFQFNDRVSGIAELFGRAGLVDFDRESSPFEVNAAVKIRATKAINVLAGGGAGLGRGIGAPDVRVFASVGWAPDYRDDDKDGISNLTDRCPLVAEDKDQFEDEDGCPEDDNDGDRREDSVDQCPNEKEDIDGFEDEDGCPEPDNDKDGFPDIKDRCPNEAEDGIGLGEFAKDGCPGSKADSDSDGVMDDVDKCLETEEDMDGFEDWDGCPEADNDKDGIPDASDKCPVCAEDKDDFQDEDGCPELDNDNDGIPDSRDECPMKAENINGKDDADGCPDRGGRSLATLSGKLLRFNKNLKFRKNRLRSSSKKAVNQAAAIIKAHPEVTKWLIVAAPKRRGSEEAAREQGNRWARVIKAQLLINGVESERLDTLGGSAASQAIVIRIMETTESAGGFVCPAQFKVEPREPGEEPETAPAPAPAAEGAGPAAPPPAPARPSK